MTDRTQFHLPTADDCDPARCFVAIELSKKSWLVAVLTSLSEKVSLHTLPAGNGKELLALLERARRRSEDGLGRRVEILLCYEAGYDGFWLHRLLEGHEPAGEPPGAAIEDRPD